MNISAHIYEGALNLFSSKLRSVLALLGILVGTASVVAMISAGKLAENEALKQFKALGTDLLAVNIKESQENTEKSESEASLTIAQAREIIKTSSHVLIVSPYTQLTSTIQFLGHELNGGALGITEEFATVVHIVLANGRFISNLDRNILYCVIGNNIYKQIKDVTLRNPIGRQIQIGKNIFTIVGIAEPWPESSFLYATIDDSVMIPLSTSLLLEKDASINNVIMQLSANANLDQIKSNAESYLHSLLPNNTFLFRSAKELIAHMSKQTEIFTVFLGLIGGISLIVGGIGVMNIMLVSIIERQREIGIRRAVGATRSDIRYLFLVEALILSLLGGSLGILLGIFAAYLIAYFWHWTFTLFFLPPLIGFSVSAATGIFFGFYPAHKASQLDPIESLRSV